MADAWTAFDSQLVALASALTPRHRPSSLAPRRLSTSFPPPPPSSHGAQAAAGAARLSLVDLPEDLFFHVFDYLSTLALLRLSCHPPSRAFQQLVHGHSVFDLDLDRELSDRSSPSAHPPPARSLLASRERYAPLIPLALRSPHLSLLTLASFGPLLTDAVVQPIIDQHAPTLLSLCLAHNDLVNPSIASASLSSVDLSRNRRLQCPRLSCPALVQLDLSRTFVNDFDLAKSCEGLTRLRVLRLQSCKNVRLLPLRLPHLSIVDLSNTAVVDEAVARIAQSSPVLSVLFANECSTLRAPAIASATLTVLSLRSCESLRAPTILCPALTELDLSDTPVTDAALVTALSSLPLLRGLSLRQCYQLSQPVLARPLLELVSLDLSMSGVHSEGLQSFIERARGLEVLQAAMCPKVVDGLMTHAPIDSLPALSEVSLRSTNVSDDDVTALAKAAPLLSHLNLSACVNVTALSTAFESLVQLDLSYCSLSDASLSAMFAAYLPRLLSASFDHCGGLVAPTVCHGTVEELTFVCCRGMDSLAVDCPSLTSIDLSSNHALSSVSMSSPTAASLKVLVARSLNQLTLHTLLTEDLAGRPVDVRSLSRVVTDAVYHPITQGGAVRPARQGTSVLVPSRRVTTPTSAALSPTASLSSPTPSPASAVSVSAGEADADQPRRSAPRPIERRREQKDEDDPTVSPHTHSYSPSSRSYLSGSPVRSRYLQPKSRHANTLTAPVTASSSSASAPLTPPLPARRTAIRKPQSSSSTSTPVSPASAGVAEDVPPSPHALSSTFGEVSGTVLPFSSSQLKRSASALGATISHPQPGSFLHPYAHPFPLGQRVPGPPLQMSGSASSLSTLLQSKPIPRSALLSTTAVAPSIPSPLTSASSSAAAQSSSASLLPSPSRFEARASSLSSVDSLPRSFLNSIELIIIQSHITEIEARLRSDDAARAQRRPSTTPPSGDLSTAVRYGLKKQLALLKARLRKEEKLVLELSRRVGEVREDDRWAQQQGSLRKASS